MRESQKERDGIIQVNSMLEVPVNACVCVCVTAHLYVCVGKRVKLRLGSLLKVRECIFKIKEHRTKANLTSLTAFVYLL